MMTKHSMYSLEYENGEYVCAQLEANVGQCITKPLGSQDSSLLFRVHLKNSLPCLEIHHEKLKIVERYSRTVCLVHKTHNLSTNV